MPPSKKQHLASPGPESMPRDSLRIREESIVVPMQEPRVIPSGDLYLYICTTHLEVPLADIHFLYACKEPIPLDNDEKEVDYEYDDTNAYLTKPDDVDDEPDFEAIGEAVPLSFPTSSHLELIVNFEGDFGALEPVPTMDMTAPPAPAQIFLVRWKLIVNGFFDNDDDALVSTIPIGARRRSYGDGRFLFQGSDTRDRPLLQEKMKGP
ncbi:uncharacterized protein A4U43_C01F25620 [Asparagus officinalis]|uniref:Uncharacterized protein n=1 Tax=Asparagus officinalis TaxID=4686 RepID=A0A5P1FQS4_ASPOF|nr:uncharacterized protein A4U43_C01F16980 [Asparagus officinalis]ONK81130.1 uncharacterized protein A4U43_C01F25620 [Asparagus officinalis]